MSDYVELGSFKMPSVNELFELHSNEHFDLLRSIFEADFEADDQVDGQETAVQPAPVPGDQEPEADEGVSTSNIRFQKVTDEQIKKFEEAHQSDSTKLNTKWVVKLFQDWHVNEYQICMDFETISENDLSWKLRKFYCEAKSKTGENYHKNSLKNIRAGLNRHLSDIGRKIDIVRGIEFKSANKVLDGMLKEMVKSGVSKPTKHKAIIESYDLQRISQYFQNAESNPIILRQAVWYNLSIHFVSRGLEFHHQLLKTSLLFNTDDSGAEYVTLSNEYQQKNFQGGLHSEEAPADKRMYATGQPSCPVHLLRKFLDKTDDEATHLFNTCTQDAVTNPVQISKWFSAKQLSKRTFSNFMP
ncbi:hypothetical protein FSP39_014603 [Pinctada imbricata]|uniref:Uncharacterized protein n=1 Tax=Pinctada imbricata TaxID=66713 RepID=A0AA88Y8L5_PINIB|nr:hypothetical protein FSP39_014603 [Pinctada imbricata]